MNEDLTKQSEPEQSTQPLKPTTTEQEDITFAGQRRVNLIWECTQAFIAVAVVLANLIVGVMFGINQTPAGNFPSVLSSSLFLVIGFYFSRTNHAAIGGLGPKPIERYEGR